MKTYNRPLCSGFILLLLSFSFCSAGILRAEEMKLDSSGSEVPASAETKPKQAAVESVVGIITALEGDKAGVKAIEAQETKTKQKLAATQEEVTQTKKEAEKVIAEKELIAKEVEVKEQAATVAQKEAELLKKEAEIGNDEAAKKRAAELEAQAQTLKQEAESKKEKLSVVESKAAVLSESAAAQVAQFESLRHELAQLKREKSGKKGWIDRLIWAAITIGIGLLFLFLMQFGINKFEKIISKKGAIRESETTLRLKTMSALFRWLGSLTIVGFMAYVVLEHFGIDMTPLIAGAGIIGLAFGFGGQYLIRDIINGIFILVEGQYRINDVVKIGDLGGLVESVNLRHTRLRDLEGRVIYIPNGKVETVINYTQEYAQALMNIGVAYKEDVDQVMQVLAEIAEGMREDPHYGRLILDKFEMLGVDEFADSQVTIKCRIKTLPIKQWEVGREFRRRVKKKFDELDIEIPFPHRTIYQGKDKDLAKLEQWRKQRAGNDRPDVKKGGGGNIG